MSIKTTIKSSIKKFIKNSFLDEILQDRIQEEQNKYSTLRLNNRNIHNPYLNQDIDLASHSENLSEKIIFISSRFRSGSTLLWNLFRHMPDCTSYYEPFNERRWFDTENRGKHVDNTHKGINDYWREYEGLGCLSKLYNEDWIRHELYMDRNSSNLAMESYINCLAENSKSKAVLQFNRIDFRLPWLHSRYPNATFLHLYRNPREQWVSFLRDSKKQNKDVVADHFEDFFYLHLWAKDLALAFPPLKHWKEMHPYELFYLIWKLSFNAGKEHSDLSISFEEIVSDPKTILLNIAEQTKIQTDNLELLSSLIVQPDQNKWESYANPIWFESKERKIETLLRQLQIDTSKEN